MLMKKEQLREDKYNIVTYIYGLWGLPCTIQEVIHKGGVAQPAMFEAQVVDSQTARIFIS